MNKLSPLFAFFLFAICTAVRADAGGMIEEVDTYAAGLAEDTPIKVNGRDLLLKKGTSALFYIRDGEKTDRLYMGTLAAEASFTFQGKELKVPAPSVVWFHESGNIKYATSISEPTAFTVQGKEVVFNPMYDVYVPMGFHDNGRFMRGSLAEKTEFIMQESPAWFKGMVVFSETDRLVYGMLAEDTVVMMQGKSVAAPAGTTVSFYDNGEIKECGFLTQDTAFLAGDETILFTSYRTSAPAIYFFQTGGVLMGSLAEDTAFTVNGNKLLLKGKSTAVFHENGVLKIGSLAEGADFIYKNQQVNLPAGSVVEFDEEGNLVRFSQPPHG